MDLWAGRSCKHPESSVTSESNFFSSESHQTAAHFSDGVSNHTDDEYTLTSNPAQVGGVSFKDRNYRRGELL